jgi:hypothetical protein
MAPSAARTSPHPPAPYGSPLTHRGRAGGTAQLGHDRPLEGRLAVVRGLVRRRDHHRHIAVNGVDGRRGGPVQFPRSMSISLAPLADSVDGIT